MYLTLACVLVLIAAGVAEYLLHRKRLERIPIRILVNGTRGKTGTARMIAAALNRAGIRTICRTTGSEAQIIYPDGTVRPFRRRLPARISEMIPLIRLCSREGVHCAVVECMALGEENQRVISEVLVRPTHVVITNSYVDHVSEIGATGEETVWTLARSINPGCRVYCTEESYRPYCEQKKSLCNVVKPDDNRTFSGGIKIHPANAALTLAICADLGVDLDTAIASFADIVPDKGLGKDINPGGGAVLVPDFAVNDLTCMEEAVRKASENYPGRSLVLVFNNRSDREYRIALAARVVGNCSGLISEVCCIGDYPGKVRRYFSRRCSCPVRFAGVDELALEIKQAGPESVYVGIGNIKGGGERLLECLEEGI